MKLTEKEARANGAVGAEGMAQELQGKEFQVSLGGSTITIKIESVVQFALGDRGSWSPELRVFYVRLDTGMGAFAFISPQNAFSFKSKEECAQKGFPEAIYGFGNGSILKNLIEDIEGKLISAGHTERSRKYDSRS
ncbi:MAG TPA: hypothetical protein VLH19_03375 [Patescibacteria group bacterium]|nr:hypothetical protein [Patescibacteria group bacterium]